MINLRSFEVPTVVKHAPGAITLLADQAKALGCKRPLLVTDKGLVNAGLVAEAAKALKAGNVDFVLFDGVVANPPIELVDNAALMYKAEGCDGLIGFGCENIYTVGHFCKSFDPFFFHGMHDSFQIL